MDVEGRLYYTTDDLNLSIRVGGGYDYSPKNSNNSPPASPKKINNEGSALSFRSQSELNKTPRQLK